MSTDKVFKASQGEVFIQLRGPSPLHPLVSLGQCTDLDDIVDPGATIDPILCRDENRQFVQIGEMETAPTKVTTSITIFSGAIRSALEKVKCSYSLYAVQGCGTKGTYAAGQLFSILKNARNEQKTFGNVVKRVEDGESTFAAGISAWLPVIRAVGATKLTVERIATSETENLDDIVFNRELICDPDCDQVDALDPGDEGLIGAEADGAAASNPLLSVDSGATWAAAGAQPFGVGEDISAVARVSLPTGGERWIVSKLGDGTAMQGEIAFSDDDGANWTVVNLGGATDGHGATRGGGIFAADYNHIWLASASGYIYFSADGGATWTAQEQGTIGVGDYTQIKMYDKKFGIAGAPADVIAVTRDGGTHWAAATATGGGGDMLTVDIYTESKCWVGTDDGTLWFSNDLGTTWTQVTDFVGTGAGTVQDIQMVNEHVGWMIENTAGPVGYIHRSVDGGRSWQRLTNPAANVGLNALWAIDENNAWAVGEVVGATGLIYRAYES